ncbi:MAG: SixA phosphatase family protein [Gammaproteobacteria bacterium]
MARKIILVRHAKSDWDGDAPDDFSRPLNTRGREDAYRTGAWLVERDYVPALILSSTSVRTRETVARLGAGAGVGFEPRTRFLDRLYHGSSESIAAALADNECGRLTMVVAHNPGLEDFLHCLSGRHEWMGKFSKAFPTCGVYVVETMGKRRLSGQLRGKLIAHMRPKLLR